MNSTPKQAETAAFAAWMKRHKLSAATVAAALEVSPTSVYKWKREGAPLLVRLACSAYSVGLRPVE